MRGQGADEVEVATMLRLLRDFEGKCLAGEPSTAEECQQVTGGDRRVGCWCSVLSWSPQKQCTPASTLLLLHHQL